MSTMQSRWLLDIAASEMLPPHGRDDEDSTSQNKKRSKMNDDLDHSLVPLATSLAFDFTENRTKDLPTMLHYEFLCSKYFLVCASYMQGHSTYVDLRSLKSIRDGSDDEYGDDDASSLPPYNISISTPICHTHNLRDSPCAISRVRNIDWCAPPGGFMLKDYELRRFLSGKRIDEDRMMRLVSEVNANSIRQKNPILFESMKKTSLVPTTKRFVPIFGVFFSKARSADIPCSGCVTVKQRIVLDKTEAIIEIVCTSCQTERFFCNSYYKNEITRMSGGTPADSPRVQFSKYTEISSSSLSPPKENAWSNSRKRKREEPDNENYSHEIKTTTGAKKRVKREHNHNTVRCTAEIPQDVIENHILNRVLTDCFGSRLREFNPLADSVGAVTNYVVVKRTPSFYSNTSNNNNNDRSVTETQEDIDKIESIGSHDVNKCVASALRNSVLSDKKYTQHLVVDDLSAILDVFKTISTVCKSWNEYAKKHFAWQIVFQGVHTLFNSGRVTVTMNHVLAKREEDAKSARYRLDHETKKVHGLFDCHIFASYVINVFSSLLFDMINLSANKTKTENLFKNTGGYRSLVRMTCTDTLSKWDEENENSKADFYEAIDACRACFHRIMEEIDFGTPRNKKNAFEKYEAALNNVNIEKSINILNP